MILRLNQYDKSLLLRVRPQIMSRPPTDKGNPLTAVVTGDVTTDFNIAISQEKDSKKQDWNTNNYAQVYQQRGSALMLVDLIRALVKRSGLIAKNEDVRKRVACPHDRSSGRTASPNRFYSTWSKFEYGTGKTDKEMSPVWRVEEVLGFQKGETKEQRISPANDNDNADIVIIDDANLGFRKQADPIRPELWTRALLNKKRPPWVLVKMSSPVADAEDALWDYLHKNHADKLIALISIDDLRLTEVQISRELSWELTAQDLIRELICNPKVNALSQCAYVVVLFGADGAVLLSRPESVKGSEGQYLMPKAQLFFDPKTIEGMWRLDHPGGMIGYKTCMAGSLALSLFQGNEKPDIEQAVESGLRAVRKLHLDGYGTKDTKISETKLAFPLDLVAKELIEPSETESPFVRCDIRAPVSVSGSKPEPDGQDLWTILGDRHRERLGFVARRIVLEGPEKALEGVPFGVFGKLLTVDRREIEGFRSIRSLVGEYVGARTGKPLSISVFGPPGSGKSFGVAQLAESLLPGRIKKLTFNLSQFGSAQDLWCALHQVRDVSLTGKLPLVFWDEFDTAYDGKPLGWLRYFLAPMQDGEFQEGQITHPIGEAVFVFAGGTAESLDSFSNSLDDEDQRRKAKLPDFISRLKGFVNILGPNPVSERNGQDPSDDNFFVIRRAILLRSLLLRDTPQFYDPGTRTLRIDEGVLKALLRTKSYKHGARSMESVIAMSLTKGEQRFERSSLPSEAQLDLHVESDDFMSKVNQIDFSGEMLENLARKVHETYQRIYEFEAAYDSLSEHEKDLNRDFAATIVGKLDECKCLVVADRGIHQQFAFTSAEVELLAKMEHERWLGEKIRNNFRYASEKEIDEAKKLDPNVRLNSSMLLWDKLSDKDFDALPKAESEAIGRGALPVRMKENNKKLIRGIPDILASVGHTIVRK